MALGLDRQGLALFRRDPDVEIARVGRDPLEHELRGSSLADVVAHDHGGGDRLPGKTAGPFQEIILHKSKIRQQSF